MRRLLKLVIVIALFWGCWTRVPAVRDVVAAPLNLAHGVVTAIELQNLNKLILMERSLNGRYPNAGEFTSRIAARLRSPLKDPLQDSWGRRYAYRNKTRGFELRSAGPDGRFHTPDDLTLTHEEM